MKNTWILPVAALAIGATGGYLTGKGPTAGAPSTVEESAQRTRSNTRSDSSATADSAKKAVRAVSTDEIARMPGNSTRIQALLEFYAGLTPAQLAEEASKLDGLPMNERIMASFLLFGRWAEVDPTAAMAFSNTMGFGGAFVRPTVLQSWASVDPANAAKYFAENPREFDMMGMMGGGRGPMGGQGGASIIASEWARQDPAAAMAWAATLAGNEKGNAMSSVVSEVAKSDPRKAADMISQLDAEDQAGAYRSVAAQYGALDFTEAQTWIRSLPADEQAEALASAIGGLSNSDPEAAAKQYDLMADGEEKSRVFDDVVGDLARKDPALAAAFLKKQTDEGAQRDGIRELMPTWVNQDPAAALAYAESFGPGGVRDRAVESYVMSNTTSAPKDVMSVAETITDEGDRNRAIGMTAMRWMREDEDAAKAYVESSTTLSDEAKERIIEGRGLWGGRGRGNGGGRGGNR